VSTAIVQAVQEALQIHVAASGSVSGGDVADAIWCDLDNGQRVFAKSRAGAPASFFETEAGDLEWLREASALEVPRVLHVGSDKPLLVLEWIERGQSASGSESDFGRRLAQLHRAGASSFGRSDCRTTGSRHLPNEPVATWAEHYATNRLLPLVEIARDGGEVPSSIIDAVEAVAARLEVLEVPVEPPARLHGDLWAGNRMIDRDGTSWLIDPACHGGHREFDLAMMQLFGGFGQAAFAAYDEAFPLAGGWDQRVPLHQLAPLFVHAIKFGSGYWDATASAARLFL